MKTSILLSSIILAATACTPEKKDFTQVKPDMDSAQVIQLVGSPSEKNHANLFGKKVSMWFYERDTAFISLLDGKVKKVAQGQELIQSINGIGESLEGLKKLRESISE